MKFKIVALFLVLGLIFGLGAKAMAAATSYDNVPGEIVAGIWECTDGDIETVFMIKNVSSSGGIGDVKDKVGFHYGIYDECSNHLYDGYVKLTKYDSTGLVLKVEDDVLYLVGGKYDPGETKTTAAHTVTKNADGYYRGYIVIYDTGTGDTNPTNPIAMSSSIYAKSENWYTGINCVSVQDASVSTLDDARSKLNDNLKEPSWFGRWYSEKDNYWNGAFLLCFPGGKDACDSVDNECRFKIAGTNYDEDEHPASFEITIKEVDRVPIKDEYTDTDIWIPAFNDANSGWVEIDNATCYAPSDTRVGMFGFFILEKPDTNAADVLPLWHSE